MYYKLYRRRKFIYIGLAAFGILVLLLNQSPSNEQPKSGSKKEDEANHLNNLDYPDHPDHPVVENKKQRINMRTYVEPEPCLGCPGENGAGVHLSVRHFLVAIFSTFLLHNF